MKIKMYVVDLQIPRRTKRIALLLGVPVTILFGVVAIAYASITTFNPGDPLSSATMNGNFSDLNSRLTAVEGAIDAGASNSPLGAIVWRDTTGAVVPVVRLLADSNPQGVFEVLDPISGAVWDMGVWNPPSITPTSLVGSVYTSANCAGTEYAAAPPPSRYSFTDASGANPGVFYVVPDGIIQTQFTPVSFNFGGGCAPWTMASVWGVPYTSLMTVTPPSALPGAPPYHPQPL
jgi:hypothetical protein